MNFNDVLPKIKKILDSPSEEKLYDYLMTLPYNRLQELIALMYLGRGDAFSYDQMLKEIEDNNLLSTSESIALQIVSKEPVLWGYLSDGLEKINPS